MAEGFAFEIVGDAGKANKAIGDVTRALDLITPKAGAAGRSINAAFDQAAAVVNKYSAAALQSVSASDKLAAVLARQEEILREIHGPMQTYTTDVQALNALLAKGTISAEQYNARLAQAKQTYSGGLGARGGGGGGFDVSSALGGLPGGSIIAGAAGGGVAGAATAGVQTAVQGAGEIIAMADAYTNMQNRLRSVTGSTEAAREAFEKIREVANHTRSDLSSTTEAFVRISNATKQMGISQDQTLKFTERLNELTQLSGATAAESAGAMMQLSQALASGTLRGDEFNSINEQMHPLITMIAQNLHVTEGEMRKLAESGQLTGQIIYDAVTKGGAALDEQFAQTTPTISAQFVVLKNEVTATVGELAQSAEVGKAAKAVFDDLKTIIAATTEQTKLLTKGLGELGISLGDLTGGGLEGIRGIEDFAMNLSFSWDMFDKGKAKAIGYSNVQDVINRVIAEGTGKLREYDQEMIEMALRLAGGAAAAKGFADAIYQAMHVADAWNDAAYKSTTINDRVLEGGRLLGQLFDNLSEKHKKAHKELRDYYEELRNAPVPRNLAVLATDHSVTNFGMVHGAGGLIGGGEYSSAGSEAERMVNEQADAIMKANGRLVAEQEALTKKSEENAKRMAEAYANAAGSIAADLINAFAAGDVSADKLLRKAAILAIQLAALSAGGSGGAFLSALAGGIGGGKTGFDYLVGSGGLQLPGFQSGGSITRQAGGPEPMLAMWWMQPNESIHVRTEEQRNRAAQGAGGGGNVTIAPVVKVLMPPERRDIVDDSRQGLTTLVRLQREVDRGRRR